MRALLTYISVRRSGNVARRTEETDSQAVRVGRSLANQIPLKGLSVSLHHAEFVLRADGVYLVPLPASTVLLSGLRIEGDVRVGVGDVVRISGYELRVAGLGENNFDLLLEIQRVEESRSELDKLRERSQMQFEHGLWTRRSWSWIAVVAVLAGTLIGPLATGMRSWWNTGPISNNHAAIANDCAACHSPFSPVKNEACLDCHPQIGSHAEKRPEFAYLDSMRCAGCHLEHGGDEGLAALEDVSCASCHANLDEHHETQLGRSSDFAALHPEFTLHMLNPMLPAADQRDMPEPKPEPEIVRVAWTEGAKEASGLAFGHLTHVGGVRFPDSTSTNLRCDACHVVDEGGRRMKPIGFEEHCRSCHPLNYGRGRMRAARAHHGEPRALRRQLRLAYLDNALPREPGETMQEHRQRKLLYRIPGTKSTPEEQQLIDYVNGRVDSAFALLMGDEYCGLCHDLLPDGDGVPTDVAPVALTRAWFGATRFDHSSHSSTRCGDCHPRAAAHSEEYAARTDGFVRAAGTLPGELPYGLLSKKELERRNLEPSRHASDVLVLGKKSCRGCHGGSLARPPEVASPCVMCHPFHHADREPIASRTLN